MGQRSVTLDNDLELALEEFIADQPDAQTAASVVQSAVREYLRRRGYAGSEKRSVTRPENDDVPYIASDADRRRAKEIHSAIDAYFDAQSAGSGAVTVQDALREYLMTRGVMMPTEPFNPTPAEHGSGYSDTSRDHDRVLAESVD